MMEEEQIETQQCYPVFEIQIEEQTMGESYLLESGGVKFLKMDLEVNEHGINKLSDPNMHYGKVKIGADQIQEKEEIGRGSAGIVRRGECVLGGKRISFAIKGINTGQQQHRRQLLNDLREYLRAPTSEYLTQFYTCFYHRGLVKQVIEYMDLGNLRQLINRIKARQLSLNEPNVASLLQAILCGLRHIHQERHSLHRDIKPQNILLNSRGQVKITDFGVSKCIENSIGRSVVGTLTYMSPQRLELSSNAYTYKCDIWSVGLIAFQLATGLFLPYDPDKEKLNYFRIAQRIIMGEPPTLPQGLFSEPFNHFLSRCLVKNQHDRASAKELLTHPWMQSASKAHIVGLVEHLQSLPP